MTDVMLSFPWEGLLESALPAAQSPAAQTPAAPASPAPAAHLARIVADSANRVAWLRARSQGITATDVARLTSLTALSAVAYDKVNGSGFTGNAFTEHGKAREPVIARWVQSEHGIRPSTALFHAAGEKRHLATPDGVSLNAAGTLLLAEIKTTNKAWRTIPRGYLRQVWWQQYVLGAERTLVVWEEHRDFVPVHPEPACRWVDRDENEITRLVSLADDLLAIIARRRSR